MDRQVLFNFYLFRTTLFISEYMFLREDFLLELELEIIKQSLQRKGQSAWPVLLTMHNWPMG